MLKYEIIGNIKNKYGKQNTMLNTVNAEKISFSKVSANSKYISDH